MRGIVISAVCHAVLVSLAMLGTAKPFDGAIQPIEVDLVSSEEIEQRVQESPKPEPPKPEKQSVWDFPPEKPLIQLPDFSSRSNNQTAASPRPAPASGQKTAQAPANHRQAALTPPAPSQPSIATQAPAAPSAPSVFDPASIPMLMDLPNAAGSQEKGFDFEATVTANLSGDERAAFKAHLRKCWKLPEGLVPAPTTRVVLRVYLRRDGALASEPVLIEASASRDGPAVFQAAKSALHDCQPYAFLPAEKYREWRVLDLSFTPREMAGG